MRRFTAILILLLAPFYVYWQTRIDYPTQVGRKPCEDVKGYGAVGNAGGDSTDDTAAINAAIAAAYHGGSGGGGCVSFPAGDYHVSSINATAMNGLRIDGQAGSSGVRLYADKQTGTSKPILDMTGSNSMTVRGISLNAQTPGGLAPSVQPSVGILLAPTVAGNGADSNKNRFDDVGIVGFFTVANIYNFASTDNMFFGVASQIWKDESATMYIGSSNDSSITSPYQTIYVGTSNTGEISFFQCEFHDLVDRESPFVASAIRNIKLKNVYNVRFWGGNSGNAGTRHFDFSGTNRHIVVDGMEFYSDNGEASTDGIFYGNVSDTRGLSVRNARFQGSATAGVAFGGTAGTVYPGLFVQGVDWTEFGGTVAIGITDTTPTTATISNAYLELGGKGLTPGGSVINSVIQNPGTITLQAGALWYKNVSTFRTGTAIASATTITVPPGDVFSVTGTTNITTVNTCDANHSGREITLIFAGVLTFTDGGNLKLAGNLVTSADDSIRLVCDGAAWVETGRSVN